MRVPHEVACRIEDGREHGRIETLNATRLEEPLGWKGGQRAIGFGERHTQPSKQLVFAQRLPFGKFTNPITIVWRTADAMYDPLLYVAAQVQKDVLDAVVRFVLAPPHILVAELVEAVRDLL